MVFDFKLPDIGEGLTEGEIVKWLVKEGDEVTEDQPIVEVMTDKATVELPAPRTGRISKILAQEGEVIAVGKVFVQIEESGEDAPAKKESQEESKPAKKKEKAASAEEPSREETSKAEKAEPEKKEEKEEKMLFEASSPSAGGQVGARRSREAAGRDGGNGDGGRSGKVLAAPAVRKAAREKDVDLAAVPGSGPAGRVTRKDLEEYLESGGTVQVRERARAKAPEAVEVPRGREEERVPLRGVRRVIADAMARSTRTAAHFTYVEEVDCTNLVELREKAKKIAQEQHGISMTYLPFIIKATVAALKQVPIVNSAYDETTQEIVYRKYYDIGIAVATEPGLIVPVIRDADKKDMFTLQKEMTDLSERTREGKAKPDELRGSTFTITSLGKTGGVLATPVINHPEVAIMGVHEIKDKPVVRKAADGSLQVAAGKLMNLSFSFDHRIVDGAVGADFAQRIVRYLENPELLLLEA